jgi:hypothetical protein
MRVCSKCRKVHDREARYCLSCQAAYMREWRKSHPPDEEQRRRAACRSTANIYKRRGKLVPQPCQICGCADVQMHHPDHELPLQVAWLCKPCHLGWHAFWRAVSAETWKWWTSRVSGDVVKQEAAE